MSYAHDISTTSPFWPTLAKVSEPFSISDRTCRHSTPDSVVYAAVSALAYSNHFLRSAWLCLNDKVTASEWYAATLLCVQHDLQDEATAKSDPVLVAVYLMGLYEVSLFIVLPEYHLRAALLRSQYTDLEPWQTMRANQPSKFLRPPPMALRYC